MDRTTGSAQIDFNAVDLARVHAPEFADRASEATKSIQARADVNDLLDDPPALRKRLLELSFEPDVPVSIPFEDVQSQIALGQSAITKTLEAHPEWRVIKFQDREGSDFFQNVPVGVESVDRRRPRDRISPARAETDAVLQAFEDLGDIAVVQPDDLAPRSPLSVSRTDG